MALVSGIIFEPSSHTYTKPVTGRQYDSVTTILEASGASGDTSWFRDWHRTRGSRVHHLGATICHLEHPSSNEEWDETSDFPEITPYGRQVQAWCRDIGFEVMFSETPVYDDDFEVAGTPDLIGIARRLNNLTILVDMKSGRVPPSVGLQTGIYQPMAEKCHGIKIDKRYSLLLRGDKPYQFRECEDRRDKSVFISMLNGYRWRQANGLLQKGTKQ